MGTARGYHRVMASEETPDETIRAATRALSDATAALTRLLRKEVTSVVPEVGEAIASSLREASRGLAEASEKVERSVTPQRAEERRRERVDRTRAELLAAAARVFAQRGFEGATVGDIAADAGFTKGAVYAHFASKSEVFLALARQSLVRCGDDDVAAVPGVTADGVDQPAVAAWIRQAQDDPRLLLTLEFVSYGLRHPEARAELGEMQQEGLRELAQQMGAVRRPESVGDGTEPTEADWDTALAVVSIANMVAMLGLLTDSSHASPEAAARIIARLVAD